MVSAYTDRLHFTLRLVVAFGIKNETCRIVGGTSGSNSGEYEGDAPRSHVQNDRRFKGAYCLHHQGDEASNLRC